MPWACYLYPTTDQHLEAIASYGEKEFRDTWPQGNVQWMYFHKHADKIKKLGSFILKNRKDIKFRIQHVNALFYTDDQMSKEIISIFWEEWINIDSVPNNQYHLLDENSVLCKRLPLGKYQYQVHLKKNMHRILKQNQRENLYRYLSQNPDTCRISNKTLEEYLNGSTPYAWEGYFYVRDEKMLTPLYMIAPEIIQKVMRFVKVTK